MGRGIGVIGKLCLSMVNVWSIRHLFVIELVETSELHKKWFLWSVMGLTMILLTFLHVKLEDG